MASLQVRDLPDQIYQKLKEEAEREHRSIAQQAIVSLANGLDVSLDRTARRQKLLSIIKRDAHKYISFNLRDPVDLVREDRNR